MTTHPLADRVSRVMRGALSPSASNWRALVVLAALSVAHQWALRNWYIEDAAISFSYARNWANGDGLVTSPGGERVEGFSNPTWVALLTIGELLGWSSFDASKVLGWLFGAATLPFVFLAARHLRPNADQQNDDTPLLACLFLAFSPQFAIWNTSGLENSLFNLLMAAGIWRLLVETESTQGRGRWPVSAFLFFLLAITRPEAMIYAAIAGFWGMVFSLTDGRGLGPTLAWLLAYFVPWGAYQAVHLAYFAWPLPNTYYAKTDAGDFSPWNWTGRGWKYVRSYAHDTGAGYLAPLYLAALIGTPGRRRLVWALSGILLATLLLYPGTDQMVAAGWPKFTPPAGWVTARIWALLVLGLVLPRLLIGRPGWRATVLAWDLFFAASFFALWSGGDWMKGYRWFAMPSVPMALLFAAGVARIADGAQWMFGRHIRERWTNPGWLTAFALAAAMIAPSLAHTRKIAKKPETTPFSVKTRVDYINKVRDRLFLDEPIASLDVDMGANMWWSGHQNYDIAGLVDVPMAHHNYEKPFVREYLFNEVKPAFAHVHGGWANTSKIPQHPEWKRDYIEIPPYKTGKTATHPGNHVRRDLFLHAAQATTPSPPLTQFGDTLDLVGIEWPGEIVGKGRALFIEIRTKFSSDEPNREPANFRLIAFVSNETAVLQSTELAPGYDWALPKTWKPGETFVGRYALRLSKSIEPGAYTLGLLVTGPDGAVWAADAMPTLAPRFADGEYLVRKPIQIVSEHELTQRTQSDLDGFEAEVAATRCKSAEDAWNRLRRRYPRDVAWIDRHHRPARRLLAVCWTRAAAALTDRTMQREWLNQARIADFREPTTVVASQRLAQDYYREGLSRREKHDWELAYQSFSHALSLDPQLAWARRYAEEARDHRLNLVDAPGTKRPDRPGKSSPSVRVKKPKAKAAPGGTAVPPALDPEAPSPDPVGNESEAP